MPSGDTGPSRGEPPPVRMAALCSVLGTETAGFRVAPEVTVVEAASPSAVMPCRARLACGLLASGLHHSVNKIFSLMTAQCCEARFLVTRGSLYSVYPRRAPKARFPVVSRSLRWFTSQLCGSTLD